mmetsp:Transcript_11354/g.18992  ORF Transcript_11354/g.18992 Transcript_11354/m.18992 type:complete len:109 (-) Transcript_11354:1386-1712(-)
MLTTTILLLALVIAVLGACEPDEDGKECGKTCDPITDECKKMQCGMWCAYHTGASSECEKEATAACLLVDGLKKKENADWCPDLDCNTANSNVVAMATVAVMAAFALN